jgi:hypothetical protein
MNNKSNTFEFNETLMERLELMKLIGCKDPRTVAKWCKVNNVLLAKLGKRRYVRREAVQKVIQNELNALNESIETLNKNCHLLARPSEKKRIKRKKTQNSRAAEEYIKKFKAA